MTALAGAASAQDAESLFDQGLSDMLAGHFGIGCPKLAESYRLEPQPGVLFTLAECYRREGRIATASARYGDFLELYKTLSPDEQRRQRERFDISNKERTELLPLIPRLTVILPSSAPPITVVTKDGSRLRAEELGAPLPVDPGEHVFTTQAPGGPLTRHRTNVRVGDERRIELTVVLPATEADPVPGAAPAVPDDAARPSTDRDVARASDRGGEPASTRRGWAYAFGTVGVAGIVVGAVTGALVLSQRSVIRDSCNSQNECDPAGLEAADRARKLGLVSTIGFGIGAAGLTTGTLLWVSAGPSPRQTTVRGGLGQPATPGAPEALFGVSGRF